MNNWLFTVLRTLYLLLSWVNICIVIMKKNILLLVVSILLIVAICELLVRTVAPQINSHDSMFQFEKELGWEFIPNKKGTILYEGGIDLTVQVNEDGYRDVSFKNKTEMSSIMVLGDSFVSNISVENEEVFTQLMENQLANSSVYNLGVNGYGQVQEYLVLKKWFPKIQPDLIVVLIYLRNDFTDNIGKYPWLYPRPTVTFDTDASIQINPPTTNFKNKKKLPFYYRSHLYRFVKKSMATIKSKTGKADNAFYAPPEIHTCSAPFSDETKEMYEIMEKLLLEINQYGKENNTPIVFALAPSMFQVEDELWSQVVEYDTTIHLQNDLPNRTLLDFAKKNKLEMIDLMPSLQIAHRSGSRLYNSKEQHWTVQGNKVVADVLSGYIKGLKLRLQDSLQ